MVIELKDGLRLLPANSPPNRFIMPHDIPRETATNIAIEHRRMLLQPFQAAANDGGLISPRNGVDLACYYAMHLHLYALGRLVASRTGDPDHDQWVAAQEEASRIYYWVFRVGSKWSARTKGFGDTKDFLQGLAKNENYVRRLVRSIRERQDQGLQPRPDLSEFVDKDLTRRE